MKTAIYTRVSTEEQAKEGYSIDAQESRLKDFARSQGWEIADMYVDDGYSAKDLERPEMKRLIKDIKKGKIDVVLVYKLDRLVRSVLNLHELLQIFDKHDVKFRSATEMFDTTSAMGRFFITLVGAMAQWERENLAERVKMGMEQKHQNGERNGGPIPFGYDRSSDGKLVKNEEEGKILMRIFEMHKKMSLRSVAIKLNNEGHQNREGRWNYSTLQYIASNPVYYGKLRWDDEIVDGDHEPYITEEAFLELQNIRTSRFVSRSKTTNGYIYTGVLRCGKCGSRMIGTGSRRKKSFIKSYKCMGKTMYGTCDLKAMHESRIDEAVFSLFWDIENFKGLFKLPKNKGSEDTADTANQIKKELDAIKNRKKRLHMAFANGAIELTEMDEYLKEDKEREAILRMQLEGLTDEETGTVWTEEGLTEQLEMIKDAWPKIKDDQAKRNFIHRLFTSITVENEPNSGRYNTPPVITKIVPR
ncbi:recombinase family protein [Paenibacillus silvisoli]|uniref:recombinase family protein n=1 Tax=Paenibacillus silvisoli TaxID=3110539 RepID=UPI002805997D|nr:recombinase family protein [Paenibacillus silvisoli]